MEDYWYLFFWWNFSMLSCSVKFYRLSDLSYFLVINCGAGSLDASIHQRINEDICVTSEIHKSSEIINNSLSMFSINVNLSMQVRSQKFFFKCAKWNFNDSINENSSPLILKQNFLKQGPASISSALGYGSVSMHVIIVRWKLIWFILLQ